MAELARQFPDDENAAAFYALALLATMPSGERDTAVSLKAGGIAAAVLARRIPSTPAPRTTRCTPSTTASMRRWGCRRRASTPASRPASSHARHMPSHVFLPLGMWDEAVASDESAFAASVDRVKRLGLSMAQADFHSLGWLHYEYLQQGRFAKARELMRTVERAIAAPHPPGQPAPPALPAPTTTSKARSAAATGRCR